VHRKFLQVPPGEWKRPNGILPTGSGGDMCRRRINRRPKLIADAGKSLPQLAFELRQADPQAEGMTDGGLLFPEPPCIEAAGTPRHDAGKLVGAFESDGQSLDEPAQVSSKCYDLTGKLRFGKVAWQPCIVDMVNDLS
jgi:hypothetical protein